MPFGIQLESMNASDRWVFMYCVNELGLFASATSSGKVRAILETCFFHEVVDHVHVELTIDSVSLWGRT
jgi:hypothetical protein